MDGLAMVPAAPSIGSPGGVRRNILDVRENRGVS